MENNWLIWKILSAYLLSQAISSGQSERILVLLRDFPFKTLHSLGFTLRALRFYDAALLKYESDYIGLFQHTGLFIIIATAISGC